MSILGRKVPGAALVAVAVLLSAAAAMIPVVAPAAPREIHLVARGMAFYLESDPSTPNPTLTVRAGERVRVVVRNEERGIRHDFAVPALEAALDPLDWREAGSLTIEVPEEPGTYAYTCRPHRLMMQGVLRVTPSRQAASRWRGAAPLADRRLGPPPRRRMHVGELATALSVLGGDGGQFVEDATAVA
jgi:plastocyanin